MLHVRLVYRGGPDDPVFTGFKTSAPISRKANGKSIRASVSIHGSSSSVFHLKGSRCYEALGPSPVVNRLKIGHRYRVTIAIGPNHREREYTRTLTLRRGTERGVARAMRC